VICAAALLAVYFYWTLSLYVTSHGEQRLVRLPDGSSVYLNSDSRLRLDFNSKTRRVSLERGEGLFEVAKDADHPFVVDAGSRHITALGTTFVVRYEPTQTAITLVDGKVAVSNVDAVEETPQPSPAPGKGNNPVAVPYAANAPVTLSPGERLVLTKNAAPKVDMPRMDAAIAWRRGQVLLDGTALRDAVSELNRYDRRRLVIDDSRLGSVRVSGVYQTGDSLGFAHAIAELHHFAVRDDSHEIHLYSEDTQKNNE
jgi:transmembrane sensor